MLRAKLMEQMKKGKKLSPEEQEAKLAVLKDLHGQASEAMGDKIKGIKKVSVASDSEEGLKAGLDKAKEVVEGAEEQLHEDLDKDNEEGESPEHKEKVMGEGYEKDPEDCSPEELDEQIAKLMALKKQKEMKSE